MIRLVPIITLCMLTACEPASEPTQTTAPTTTTQTQNNNTPTDHPEPRTAPKPAPTHPLVAAARSQIGVTTTYDPAYVGLDYPNGDIPLDRGVCTDVVIRALRDAYQLDLQQAVHEDMKANFNQYPTIWGLSRPDKNIDHRRVPNLQTYFKRQGFQIPNANSDYQPGDLVTCTVAGNRPHIMIVSNQQSPAGTPLVIHNIGRGTQEEDRLNDFPITGHYRVNTKR